MNHQLSSELTIAIKAAKAGAQKALEFYDNGNGYTLKEDKTILTKADTESEKIIKETILAEFPHATFLAEESGGSTGESEYWIIDPVDGSRSFSRGIPFWDVLIAYVKNHEIVLGVSYFPLIDMLLYAEKGKGAFLNGKKTSVSKVLTLTDTLVGFGSLRHFSNKQVVIDVIDACGGVRSPDPVLTALFVAKGSMDVLVDAYGMTWDWAPYKVIIEEAGGKITRLDGSEWAIDDQLGCIMTNGLLHDQIVAIVNK